MHALIRQSRKAVWGARASLLVALLLTVGAAGCGDVVREGTGTSFLIITDLDSFTGAEPNLFDQDLESDVVTIINNSPTVFSDGGRVFFRVGVKDAGGVGSPNAPTQNQFITVNRYHVKYIRADGRNTPGVDVPYPFDGAFTVTVMSGETPASFTLVRAQAKFEAPLGALAIDPIVISTIAEVTFYGVDQTGHEVSAVGYINVHFANWADPD
jgi:hypothetical protein